ncbi:MFS transporter [Pseudonocardia alaniniphila]|uniref:MFS transporter n=1 Tax=Pseudonocardia alaniniphila TaxID=75291 RepID=A0ABS9TCQ6_9PSEU|nr:MFS transporter [Pseudonocardia alaniniphila]MCH6166297.1 MFS transporter [Pseudonocardia alaniniphila]
MTDQTVPLRRHRGFRRFWAASTISDGGTYISVFAVGVLIVADLGGTATDVGIVRGAGVVPYLAVGLFAGVLADRVRRKPLLVGTDLGRAVVLAGVPLLAATGHLNVPVLAALMVLFGLLSVLNAAAHQSFLPRLLPRELLPRANARLLQSDAVAQTAGPLLGGGLVAAIGAPLTVLVDAVSYALSGLLIAAVPVRDPAPRPTATSVLAELREGASWVYRHPTLRPLALSTHGWFLFNAVFVTVYVPYAYLGLGIGATGLGVTFALAGVGALLGSSASEVLGRRVGIPGTIVGSRVLEAGGIAVVAAAAAGQFVYGLGFGAEGPIELAYRQAVTPDRLQGRTNATMRSLNRAVVVVGAPLGGLLADAAGPGPALWLSASGIATAALLLAVSGFRTARHDDQPPAESAPSAQSE